MKILYAEDSISIAKHVQNVLESMGYHVTHVANGLEAVKAYQASPPDLVLMDVVMPVMDGIEATRQIKKMGGEKWVPLIIMTSLTGNNEIIEGFTAGADDYLVKPMDLNVLEARMRSMQRIATIQGSLFGILDNMYEGVLAIDDAGIVKSYNKAAQQIFGYTAEEVIGQNVKMLMPSPFRDEHDGYLARYNHEKTPRIIGTGRKVKGQRRDGSVFPMHLAVTEVERPGKNLFIGVVRDISIEEEARKRIEFLAHHDALTGLPNRARLGEVLSQAVANPYTEAALLFIDLDGFKPINDRYGHEVGDFALKEVASRLQQVIGASHFVGRLGGDEFVVLLNNITTEEGALMWANQIIDAISKPMRFNNDITCLLGASIGVACIPKHGRSNTDILSHADAAMYEAKRAGKNRAIMTSGKAAE